MLTTLLNAQFIKNSEGDLEFENVIQADSLSTQDLHDKTSEWAALTYNDAKTVTKLDRDDKIIINALSGLDLVAGGYNIGGNLDYNLIISFKHGRYKIEFKNLLIKTGAAGAEAAMPVVNPSDYTLEFYKSVVYKQTELLDDKSKKIVLKAYSKNGYLEKAFNESKPFVASSYEQSKDEIERIASSLEDYIKSSSSKNTNDDW